MRNIAPFEVSATKECAENQPGRRQHGCRSLNGAGARILHTADWQIGKPYRWVDDGQKQARLQQERVEVVGRIAEIVRREQVDAVLVAGDLFDSSTEPAATVMEVLEVVGSMSCPVLVIPGNHDHGGIGGIHDVRPSASDAGPCTQPSAPALL